MSRASGQTFNTILLDSCVSDRTLRTQDLLRAFADEYERLSPTNGAALRAEAREYAEAIDQDVAIDTENALTILEDLTSQLNYMAPENAYFGAHIGDGACFGFWSCDDIEA